MITGIIVATVVAFAALAGYASCCAAARADRQSEKYFYLKKLKQQEMEAQRKNENLKNE